MHCVFNAVNNQPVDVSIYQFGEFFVILIQQSNCCKFIVFVCHVLSKIVVYIITFWSTRVAYPPALSLHIPWTSRFEGGSGECNKRTNGYSLRPHYCIGCALLSAAKISNSIGRILKNKRISSGLLIKDYF